MAPEELTTLVKNALKMIGLHSVTMANCRALSNEIKFSTGKSISAITLFRMADAVKYKIKPYRHSIDTVEDFIRFGQKISSHPQEIVYSPMMGVKSRERPQENALYHLVEEQLKRGEFDRVISFLNRLPEDHLALGWERYVISVAIGDFLANMAHHASFETLLGSFSRHRGFRFYYIEANVDHSNAKQVYAPALAAVIKSQGLYGEHVFSSKASMLNQDAASALFGNSMLHMMHFLFESKENGREWCTAIDTPYASTFVREHAADYPFAAARYFNSKLLRHFKNHHLLSLVRDELFEVFPRWFGSYDQFVIRDFCAGIICDALLLCLDRKGIEIFLQALPPEKYYPYLPEPQLIRLKYLQSLCLGAQNERLEQIRTTTHQIAHGESAFHDLMIELAHRLFKGEAIAPKVSYADRISRSGYTRFNELFRKCGLG